MLFFVDRDILAETFYGDELDDWDHVQWNVKYWGELVIIPYARIGQKRPAFGAWTIPVSVLESAENVTIDCMELDTFLTYSNVEKPGSGCIVAFRSDGEGTVSAGIVRQSRWKPIQDPFWFDISP